MKYSTSDFLVALDAWGDVNGAKLRFVEKAYADKFTGCPPEPGIEAPDSSAGVGCCNFMGTPVFRKIKRPHAQIPPSPARATSPVRYRMNGMPQASRWVRTTCPSSSGPAAFPSRSSSTI
ncbi:MAG: hypothetical protein ABR534_10620 [Desulfotignum sp.]|nr:hypothetical protein [Desulfobacteraceae bacterium]